MENVYIMTMLSKLRSELNEDLERKKEYIEWLNAIERKLEGKKEAISMLEKALMTKKLDEHKEVIYKFNE